MIFQDWEATIARQAGIFHAIFASRFGISDKNVQATRILEIGTGIGTQLLGLAPLGYRITATDLSNEAIERCKTEVARRNISSVTEFHGGLDMRTARSELFADAPFDLILSADNCIPHLLSDKDILDAFKAFHSCLKPGGGLLITVRDYATESRESPQFRPYGIRQRNGQKYIAYQTWEFADPDPDVYTVSMFFCNDDGSDAPTTRVSRTKYRMVTVDRLIELMKEAGFTDVGRIEGDGGFYQPVIAATRPI